MSPYMLLLWQWIASAQETIRERQIINNNTFPEEVKEKCVGRRISIFQDFISLFIYLFLFFCLQATFKYICMSIMAKN